MKIFLFICLFITQISTPVYGLEIINMGKDFEIFLLNIQNTSEKSEIERHWQEFETKYQDIYDSIIYRDYSKRKLTEAFFHSLPEIKETMLIVFDHIESLALEQKAIFEQYFPNLPEDIIFVFMPLSTFQGKIDFDETERKPYLFIGVDRIVWNVTPEMALQKLKLILLHELFHVYHSSLHRDSIDGYQTSNMATMLWSEGFATYITGLLSSQEKTDQQLLINPETHIACHQENVALMAHDFLHIFYDAPHLYLYSEWFFPPVDQNNDPIPIRAYCLGLHVARKIAETHLLDEMFLWNNSQITIKVEEALKILR